MREGLSPKAVKSKPLMRRLINSIALSLVGFVLGIVPMWGSGLLNVPVRFLTLPTNST